MNAIILLFVKEKHESHKLFSHKDERREQITNLDRHPLATELSHGAILKQECTKPP